MKRLWVMFTADRFYPVEPSVNCKPEDHGNLNPHVVRIEDIDGDVIWSRTPTPSTDGGV